MSLASLFVHRIELVLEALAVVQVQEQVRVLVVEEEPVQ